MARTISAAEVRVRFGDALRRVTERGETTIVERSGKPVAVELSIEEYDGMRNGKQTKDWRDLVARTQERFGREWGDRPLSDIDRLIEDGHEVRYEQIHSGLL